MKPNRKQRFWIQLSSLLLGAVLALFVGLFLTFPYGLQAAKQAAGLVLAADGAEMQRTFNYQGTLRLPDGTFANGFYEMTFRIYDSAAGDEEALYTEKMDQVVVRDGEFSVVLGDRAEMGAEVFGAAPRYLGIQVAPDAQEMQPRQRIHPVPFALAADRARLADSATSLAQNATLQGDLYWQAGQNITMQGKDKDFTFDFQDANNGAQWAIWGPPSKRYLAVTNEQGGKVEINADTVEVNGRKPILVKRFENVGNDADFDTEISKHEYECVATGWTTRHDIDEDDSHTEAVWTYVKGDSWWAHVEFASHGGSPEDPDVDILCFRKALVEWQGADRTLFHPD